MLARWMVVSVACCLAVTPARADELQHRIANAARNNPSHAYGFRRMIVASATGEARKSWVEQYDPRRPASDRWTLVSTDGRAPTAREIQDARKRGRPPVGSYGRLAKWIATPAVRGEAGPGYVVYAFPRLPAGTLKIGSHDASADTRAEVTVNIKGATPFVERVRLTSTTAFRMMLVASVKSIAIDSRYRQLSDGTVVPDTSESVIVGSMMLKSGQMRTRVDYSNFERLVR